MIISSEQVVKLGDYDVPADLPLLTNLNIKPHDTILEIGCGVRRLAIPATGYLDSTRAYIGLDTITPSIDWCPANIAARHPASQFVCEDVYSPVHNPGGVRPFTGVVDKIFLSSVFTHMLPVDEMNRVLKPGGAVLTTQFLVNDLTLASSAALEASLSFDQTMPACPQCRSYFEQTCLQMLCAGAFELKKPIEHVQWSGIGGCEADSQDDVVFGKV